MSVAMIVMEHILQNRYQYRFRCGNYVLRQWPTQAGAYAAGQRPKPDPAAAGTFVGLTVDGNLLKFIIIDMSRSMRAYSTRVAHDGANCVVTTTFNASSVQCQHTDRWCCGLCCRCHYAACVPLLSVVELPIL